MRCARNRDAAVFQRMSQDLKNATVEFWSLVEEEHALVRQRDLAGSRYRPTSDQGDTGDGVVRGPERSRGERAGAGGPDAGNRVDGGALKRFVESEWPGSTGRLRRATRSFERKSRAMEKYGS